MPNETLITDLVAREAMQQLEELDQAMDGTLGKFQNCARELARGLKIPVEVTGDIEKLQQLTQQTMSQATQAAQQYTQQMQQQQQVIANTTNTISRQLAEQEKVNKAQREAFTQNMQALDIAERIVGTYEQNTRQLAQYTAELAKNKAAIKEVEKLRSQSVISDTEATRRTGILMAEQNKLKAAMQEVASVVRVQAKEMNAAEGSYVHLSQQLELLKKAQKGLNEDEKAGEEARILGDEIQNLDARLKDLAADMGEFQRNVGNYAIANGTMKTELRELTNQLAELTLQYGKMSAAEKQSAEGRELGLKITLLTEKAGEMRDAMDDAKQAIRGSASDTRWLDTLSNSGQLVASSFGLASSSMQLFGLTEEETRQTMLKLQSAMQAVQALEIIQNSLQKQSNIMRGIAIIQLKAQAAGEHLVAAARERGVVATKAATIAQKALNAVAKANPYVLLATAIMAIVAALVAWTTKANEAEKKAKAFTDAMKEQSGEYARNRAELERLRIEWDNLTSKKEREEWIKRNKDAFHQLGVEVSNTSDAENLLVKNTDVFLKAMTLRAQAAAYAAAAANEFQNAIEQRTQAKRREGNLSNADWFKGAMNASWGQLLQGKAGIRQSATAVARMDASGMYYNATQSDKLATDYIKKQLEIQNKIDDLMKKGGFKSPTSTSPSTASGKGSTGGGGTASVDKLRDAKELFDDIAQMQLDALEKMTDNLEEGTLVWESLEEDAIKKAAEMSIKAIEKNKENLEKELRQQKDNGKITAQEFADETKFLNEATAMSITAIETKKEKDILDLQEKVRQRQEQISAERIASMQAESDDVLQIISNETALRLNELKKQYVEELKMVGNNEEEIASIKEKYARDSARIAREQAVVTTRATVDALEQQLHQENLTDEQRKKIYQEFTKARITLEEALTEASLGETEDRASAENVRAESWMKMMKGLINSTKKWSDMIQQTIGNLTDLMDAVYDSRIEQVQELIDAENERHDAEVDRIEDAEERGAITREEAEIRKRQAEEATAKKQQELEKQKSAYEYKKNLAQKVNSISQIGIATALGIMQALAQWPPNIPLAAFVGAMGALQVATALAQPIKAYAEGTKGHPHEGGLAVVGDGGRAEIVMYGKKAWITPDTPTLIDLPKGAEVLPDATQIRGMEMLTSIPRDRISGQPIIINDYHALEERMEVNTKTMTRELRALRSSMARELRRQNFRDYINRRT